MKKFITIFLTVVLMLSLVISVSAETTYFNMKVTSSASKVRPGEQFDVTFLVTDITEDSGIIALEMIIEYDASKVNVVSKTNIFPSQWGKSAADFSPALGGNQTGSWEQRLLYDGDDYENTSIPLYKDNELGVKVTFKALENASGSVKIGLSSDLMGTGNDLDTVYGKPGSVIVSITNDIVSTTTEKAAPVTSEVVKPTTEKTAVQTQSDTKAADPSETSGTESGVISTSSSDIETSVITETKAETETTAANAGTSSSGISSAAASEAAPSASATPSTTAKSEEGGSSALTVIVIIAAVVLAAVAFFAIMKFKKTKDDDNPVNPG